jgi:hypothetical protein
VLVSVSTRWTSRGPRNSESDAPLRDARGDRDVELAHEIHDDAFAVRAHLAEEVGRHEGLMHRRSVAV